jgi:hypothetical protein
MTDHPRFQPPQGPFETAYRAHHGGNLVALVLRLAARREDRSPDAASDPMLAFDRALLDGARVPNPGPVAHRSAVRAAVVGICAILLLSAVVQVLDVWRSAGAPGNNRTAASTRSGAR